VLRHSLVPPKNFPYPTIGNLCVVARPQSRNMSQVILHVMEAEARHVFRGRRRRLCLPMRHAVGGVPPIPSPRRVTHPSADCNQGENVGTVAQHPGGTDDGLVDDADDLSSESPTALEEEHLEVWGRVDASLSQILAYCNCR
jgi:hypothetical protein